MPRDTRRLPARKHPARRGIHEVQHIKRFCPFNAGQERDDRRVPATPPALTSAVCSCGRRCGRTAREQARPESRRSPGPAQAARPPPAAQAAARPLRSREGARVPLHSPVTAGAPPRRLPRGSREPLPQPHAAFCAAGSRPAAEEQPGGAWGGSATYTDNIVSLPPRPQRAAGDPPPPTAPRLRQALPGSRAGPARRRRRTKPMAGRRRGASE